jgi:hypothetical protein
MGFHMILLLMIATATTAGTLGDQLITVLGELLHGKQPDQEVRSL